MITENALNPWSVAELAQMQKRYTALYRSDGFPICGISTNGVHISERRFLDIAPLESWKKTASISGEDWYLILYRHDVKFYVLVTKDRLTKLEAEAGVTVGDLVEFITGQLKANISSCETAIC